MRPAALALVSTSTLRAVLYLLERARVMRRVCLDIRAELLNRESETPPFIGWPGGEA